MIKRRLRVIRRNVREAIAAQMDRNAEDLLDRAVALAPQLSGDLIESGAIASRDGKNVFRRTIHFGKAGGKYIPYAVAMHECFYELGPVSREKSARGGGVGRQFLKRPFKSERARYAKAIGKATEKAIRLSVR